MTALHQTADVHVFGLGKGDIPWETIEQIAPGAKKSYGEQLWFRKAYPNIEKLPFSIIKAGSGWQAQNIYILLPDDNAPNGVLSEEYMVRIFGAMANLTANLNYERLAEIALYLETFSTAEGADVLRAAEKAQKGKEEDIRFVIVKEKERESGKAAER